jgi:Protein of unknown function (DUF2626).
MDRMFRVLSFWTGVFAVLFFAGEMYPLALLFLAQSGFFLLLGYLRLSERMYMYIFGVYLTIFTAGFTYYTTFVINGGLGN